jgi:hypothetical protein
VNPAKITNKIKKEEKVCKTKYCITLIKELEIILYKDINKNKIIMDSINSHNINLLPNKKINLKETLYRIKPK